MTWVLYQKLNESRAKVGLQWRFWAAFVQLADKRGNLFARGTIWRGCQGQQ
jgi:hypothetical protein